MKNLSFFPVLLLVLFAKLIPFNVIVGSHNAIFSWTSMMAPVVAKQFGLAWISLFFMPYSLANLLLFFLHRLPLLCAARVYQQRHWMTSILIPALCMALFVMHDVGCVAWSYSLFWLIPMALYFFSNSRINRALTAAFVAHGVGSVVWLYRANISASVWIALIPIVICERLLMAGGIVCLDVVVTWLLEFKWYKIFVKKLGWA